MLVACFDSFLLFYPMMSKLSDLRSKSDDDKALVAVEAGVNVKEVKSNVPSNVYLLNVAFYSFAIFAIGQMFVAIFVARSQAMVGDSSAMVVDSLTYLFNSYAEKIKNKSLQENDDDQTLSDVEKEIRRLNRTRQRLWLEILPPLCSVMTLIGLTIYITVDAWDTLTSPEYNKDGEDDGTSTSTMDDEPDIGVMFFFSGLNLVLDILNVTCFARAKHAFGFAVIDQDRHRYMLAYDGSLHNQYADSLKEIRSEVDLTRLDSDEISTRESYSSISEENQASSQEEEITNNTQEVNLNMCSAYTHVFADTLRSTAVLIAAGLSYMLQLGQPEIVDAVAALAVSLIILLSLGPLLGGIVHAYKQMRQLSHFATRLSEEGRPILS